MYLLINKFEIYDRVIAKEIDFNWAENFGIWSISQVFDEIAESYYSANKKNQHKSEKSMRQFKKIE